MSSSALPPPSHGVSTPTQHTDVVTCKNDLARTSNPAVLHAYDAGNLAHELYNSSEAANGRDQFGRGNKFITPVIADGKVFVGAQSGVAVFGLLD